MMIGECLRVGDRVSITIDRENREWGYNPCPDGTEATVLGFTEITWGRVNNCGHRPGIYHNTSWVRLQMPDGKQHVELDSRLKLLDSEEEKRRHEAWRKENKSRDGVSDHLFIRDLPDTPFWEHDLVCVKGSHDPDEQRMRVTEVKVKWARDTDHYCCEILRDGRPAGSMYFEESRLELVERGNVWKMAHGQKPTFLNLKEEADLAESMGLTREVRNPADGLYHWSLPEAVEAVRKGIGHSISVGGPLLGGMFGPDPLPAADSDTRSTRIQVKRFKDEELGERVRAATIEGFQK